jgi:hypothetical protein
VCTGGQDAGAGAQDARKRAEQDVFISAHRARGVAREAAEHHAGPHRQAHVHAARRRGRGQAAVHQRAERADVDSACGEHERRRGGVAAVRLQRADPERGVGPERRGAVDARAVASRLRARRLFAKRRRQNKRARRRWGPWQCSRGHGHREQRRRARRQLPRVHAQQQREQRAAPRARRLARLAPRGAARLHETTCHTAPPNCRAARSVRRWLRSGAALHAGRGAAAGGVAARETETCAAVRGGAWRRVAPGGPAKRQRQQGACVGGARAPRLASEALGAPEHAPCTPCEARRRGLARAAMRPQPGTRGGRQARVSRRAACARDEHALTTCVCSAAGAGPCVWPRPSRSAPHAAPRAVDTSHTRRRRPGAAAVPPRWLAAAALLEKTSGKVGSGQGGRVPSEVAHTMETPEHRQRLTQVTSSHARAAAAAAQAAAARRALHLHLCALEESGHARGGIITSWQ